MEANELEDLRRDVLSYAARRKGRIYAPIDHPALADIPSEHGAERFDLIASHLANMPGLLTALDIGTHWGYFAHRLERLGLEVTAVENMPQYLTFLRRLRSLYGDHFAIHEQSLFSMPGAITYDVVLGLNIFHHFIKTEPVYGEFKDFLGRLSCRVLFFQAHSPGEGQMRDAYRNYHPEEFCEFLLENSCLTCFRKIGQFGNRPLFLLSTENLR